MVRFKFKIITYSWYNSETEKQWLHFLLVSLFCLRTYQNPHFTFVVDIVNKTHSGAIPFFLLGFLWYICLRKDQMMMGWYLLVFLEP
jgi:hypothetical protein